MTAKKMMVKKSTRIPAAGNGGREEEHANLSFGGELAGPACSWRVDLAAAGVGAVGPDWHWHRLEAWKERGTHVALS
jgi:hypothetical protein